jgi:hypothetical protein
VSVNRGRAALAWRRTYRAQVDAAETVTDAISQLEGLGYRSDFSFADGTVQCRACSGSHDPTRIVVRHTFRFEGDTDPGDEAIVLGVECPACGVKGIVVSAYGPDASPEFVALLQQLDG